MNERQEGVFHWIAVVVVSVMIAGWTISIIDSYGQRGQLRADAPPVTAVTPSLTSAMLDERSTSMPFINDAALKFLDPLKGMSGQLTAAIVTPGTSLGTESDEQLQARYEKEQGGSPVISPDFRAPQEPGVYKLAVELDRARRAIEDVQIITLVPFEEKKKGRIGLYYLGTWPYESGGKPMSERYSNPAGFIEVTRENRNTHVSKHFKLADFLTKDQPNVWPKYLLLDPKLLDKLELTIMELEAEGIDVEHVNVMSGFRTPRYNHSGGNTAGRANLSRHMYGDASDIYVDNDRNATMDDLDGDGRITVRDAEVLARAAERVERKYPALVGGIAPYATCCGHGPFVHIDVRGYRARWRGTGTG